MTSLTRDDDIDVDVEDWGERFEWLGRAGWVAKGFVYIFIGILFAQIAILGGTETEANQRGAVEEVAQTPFGMWLLMFLAIGLVLYTIWRIFTVVLPGDWTGRALLDRIGYAISAITYISVLASVVQILRQDNTSASGEDRLIESTVKQTMAVPAGRWLVAVAGVIVIVVGVVFARKGWTRSFRDGISGDDGIEGTMTDHLGLVGWIARGLIMVVIGWFLILAAYRFNADEAAGFDDSIRQLTSTGWGAVIAGAIAVGFIAFGVFCVVSARFRNLEGPTNE